MAQATPAQTLSLASQFPPRSLQPVSSVSAWLCKQLVGAGLPAMQAASDKALSLASQLPPRSRQPVSSVSAWLCKQLVGAGLPAMQAASDKALSLASQLPPRPQQPSVQCRLGCASSLWERACPRCRRRLTGPIAGKPAPTQISATFQFSIGLAAQAACGSGLARDAGGVWQGPIAGKPAPNQISAACRSCKAIQRVRPLSDWPRSGP
jgi:hypothetical protein